MLTNHDRSQRQRLYRSSPRPVDQAIGVVISLGGLPPDRGFDVLRTVSQHTNVKLREVAERIVAWAHGSHLGQDIRHALDSALRDAAGAMGRPPLRNAWPTPGTLDERATAHAGCSAAGKETGDDSGDGAPYSTTSAPPSGSTTLSRPSTDRATPPPRCGAPPRS
ncbi:ANTAR domain-containing protein [Streptomyces aureus]|uniref:ANTAR domain-containing protein n=1 Tax=Streptomyces aureus TaxID=193461 RepID=UPI0036ACDA44